MRTVDKPRLTLESPSKKPSSPRKNDWKKLYKQERNKVLDEAIQKIRAQMRHQPTGWERGYNSAITQLELMKN